MCGIFGVFGHPDAARLTAQGLRALQHRGQDGAGLISYDGRRFHQQHTLGLIEPFFSLNFVRAALPGDSALGHVRYGTQGAPILANIQPFLVEGSSTEGFALAHNGHFSSLASHPDDVPHDSSASDTARWVRRMAHIKGSSFLDRFIGSLIGSHGAYACGALTPNCLMAACDPVGIRPLVLGRLGGATVIASETYALDYVGAVFLRDVAPGEILQISRQGIQSCRPFCSVPVRPCLFEYIYFAHPNSRMRGHLISEVRQRMGEALGREAPVRESMPVIPIPDSGCQAALGYARITGLPYQESIERNSLVGRTFLKSTAQDRHEEAAQKYTINPPIVSGKSVVLVDDSLVRGTTLRPILKLMREAGAREIHLRIASPPLRYPDFYGLDLPDEDDLLAARYTPDEIRESMNVDSLAFLSLESVYRAFGYGERNSYMPQFSDHCFTGEYPNTQIEALKRVA